MKKTILATLLGATLLTGSAYAAVQQTPGRSSPMMKADADRDGILTRQEMLAAADARFAKLDANKDGQISRDEHRAGKPHRGMHKRGGPDGGKGAAFRKQMLERFDADKDGKLSATERQSARQAWQAKHPEGRAPHGAGKRNHVDGNGDGVVSLAETRAAATARFDRVDANHDGKIDQAERQAAHAKRKAMRGHGGHGGHGAGAGPAPAQR